MGERQSGDNTSSPAFRSLARDGTPVVLSTVAALADYLLQFGIDPTVYGTGPAKRLEDLLSEVTTGECELHVEHANNSLIRKLRVSEIYLRHNGKLLMEVEQTYQRDGRTRLRKNAVSEKCEGNEPWHEAAQRGLREELSLETSQYEIEASSAMWMKRKLESPSFPGLVSCYEIHHACAKLTDHSCELAKVAHFERTEDTRQSGPRTSRWEWMTEADFFAKMGLPIIDFPEQKHHLDGLEEPKLRVIRDACLMMLRHHTRDECSRLICRRLTGGFSGSILLHVRRFDNADKEMVPRIFKFDDAQALRDEFERYERLQRFADKLIPEQHWVRMEIDAIAPNKMTRPIKGDTIRTLGGIEMQLVGSCWLVPGLLSNENPNKMMSDLKRIFIRENKREYLHSAQLGTSCAGAHISSSSRVLTALFGSGGEMPKLWAKSRSRCPAGSLLYELRSRIVRRLDKNLGGILFHETNYHIDDGALDSKLMALLGKWRDQSEQQTNQQRRIFFLESKLETIREPTRAFNALVAQLDHLEAAAQVDGWLCTYEPLQCLVHGDLNGANVMVDLHNNVWLIDFADVTTDLPVRDAAKLLCVLILEYTYFPIEADHNDDSTAARRAAEATLNDAIKVVNGLVDSVLQSAFVMPVVTGNVLSTLTSKHVQHLARMINQITCRLDACLFEATISESSGGDSDKPSCCEGDLHPGALLALMLEQSIKGLTYRQLTLLQKKLTLHLAVRLAKALPDVLKIPPSEFRRARNADLVERREDWQEPDFVDKERENYRSRAQLEHGTTQNPITGQELDVLSQCVNLEINDGSGANNLIGDDQAYERILACYQAVLPVGTKVWFAAQGDRAKRQRQGTIVRVNREDATNITFDVSYDDDAHGETKTKKELEVPRSKLVTKPTLIIGDPAAGKTTFCKQLLSFVMRNDAYKFIVPVIIRVIELVQFRNEFNQGQCTTNVTPRATRIREPKKDMIAQFLYLTRSQYEYQLFLQARDQGRLLVILDGYDESDRDLERNLRQEIQAVYLDEVMLVVTSRYMAGLDNLQELGQFRKMGVRTLNEHQQKDVVRRQVGDDVSAAELFNQIQATPALAVMAKNPLMLSVMVSIFNSRRGQHALLNRARVYESALESMFKRLDATKRRRADEQKWDHKTIRKVLTQIAWTVHSVEKRDFTRKTVETALEMLGDKSFTIQEWDQLAESQLKKGKFPLLSWIYDAQSTIADRFRFAHLTFQEYLVAEYCHHKMVVEGSSFLPHWNQLVCDGQDAQHILARGWWQQVIQMFSDLCSTENELICNTGTSFLRLSDDRGVLEFFDAGDGGILTLSALIHRNKYIKSVKMSSRAYREVSGIIKDFGIRSFCTACGPPNLTTLDFSQNLIGPAGCQAIARFLDKVPFLSTLNLANNELTQGNQVSDAPRVDTRGAHRHYKTCEADEVGLRDLLQSVKQHPSLTALDVRGNFLRADIGRALFETVLATGTRLRRVCGVDVESVRNGTLTELQLGVQNTQWTDPYLSTGGALFMAKILLHFPQPDLQTLNLSRNALASDAAGTDEVFDHLGKLVAASIEMTELDISGFWDCGADAGRLLGTHIREHKKLQIIKVGRGKIDFASIRKSTSEELHLKEDIRDCGGGILSTILPCTVTRLRLEETAIGSRGYALLANCTHILHMNGIHLVSFEQSNDTIDLSQTPLKSTGEVSFVLGRLKLLPQLTHLDLSRSMLQSKSHACRLTECLYPTSSTKYCDGGCPQTCLRFPSELLAFHACRDCNLDFCPTCCMSQCSMVSLAEALAHDSLSNLKILRIAGCNFAGKPIIGGIQAKFDIKGYIEIANALERHINLTHLDISDNYFDGPGFLHLAKGIARMPALSYLKIGSRPIQFKAWINNAYVSTGDDWNLGEHLVFTHALRRNSNLRRLQMVVVDVKLTNIFTTLASSLERVGPSPDSHGQSHEIVDELRINDLEISVHKLRDGTHTRLDWSRCLNVTESMSPILVLCLKWSANLVEVDFCNLRFGDFTDEVVEQVLRLHKHQLKIYNRFSLKPESALRAFSVEDIPVMPHGIIVLGETALPSNRNITDLNLASCNMDCSSLRRALESLHKNHVNLTTLNVSDNPLGFKAFDLLAEYLRDARGVRHLVVQRIREDMYKPPDQHNIAHRRRLYRGNLHRPEDDLERFCRELETNTSLVCLDVRGNMLPSIATDALSRTFNRRSVVDAPGHFKYLILLTSRLWGVSPEANQLIASFVADRRKLLLDSAFALAFTGKAYVEAARHLEGAQQDDISEDLKWLFKSSSRARSQWTHMVLSQGDAAIRFLVEKITQIDAQLRDAAMSPDMLIAAFQKQHATAALRLVEAGVEVTAEVVKTILSRQQSNDSLWFQLLLNSRADSIALVEELCAKHEDLLEAARSSELLELALHRGQCDTAVTCLERGAVLTDGILDMLLTSTEADVGTPISRVSGSLVIRESVLSQNRWMSLLFDSDASVQALIEALCAKDGRLRAAANSADILILALKMAKWDTALACLQRGAVMTKAIRDMLMLPINVDIGVEGTSFDAALSLRGAVTIESRHPYGRCDDRSVVQVPGASAIYVKFDPRSRTLDSDTYIDVLSSDEAEEILLYHASGTDFTTNVSVLRIEGSSFMVRFKSDGYEVGDLRGRWGFKLVAFAADASPLSCEEMLMVSTDNRALEISKFIKK